MANVVVVGAQWGDEGKGKIVDWLSEQADIVVRFQGGHNAGHTLVINGETYKLALLPSGVLRPSKLAVIGNGVVFDPQAFLDEVAKLKAQGVAVSPENLRVAENVTLILPLHRELDALRESSNAVTAIGTTRRGSMSITEPIPTSPRPTPWRRRRRPEPAWARAPSVTCWASARPIRPGSARARFRPNCITRSARRLAAAARSSGSILDASGASAGSMPCWCARPCGPAASTGWR